MGKDLAGKVAIVTGGSDGIGKATATLLAKRGATVAICARRAEVLEAARAEIAEHGTVEAHILDVSDEAAFTALVEDVAKRHGRLDMMVNNAMSVHYAPLTELTMEHWRKDFAVNAEAVFTGTKAAMKIMMKQGGGSIVNIASTTAIRSAPYMASYSASKAALAFRPSREDIAACIDSRSSHHTSVTPFGAACLPRCSANASISAFGRFWLWA